MKAAGDTTAAQKYASRSKALAGGDPHPQTRRRYIMLCYVTLCYIVLYYVVLCYIM